MSLAVLCLSLLVSSASTLNWLSKNKDTECGKFKIQRPGSFSGDSVTDLDTRQVLADLKVIDADKDGYITFAESTNPAVYNRVYAPLNITSGFTRCEAVQYNTENLSISRDVANTMFSAVDANSDLIVDLQDINADDFNEQDTNGDGRVSVCEVFQSFMSFAAVSEQQVYLRQLKWEDLIRKHRKPSDQHSLTFWKWMTW